MHKHEHDSVYFVRFKWNFSHCTTLFRLFAVSVHVRVRVRVHVRAPACVYVFLCVLFLSHFVFRNRTYVRFAVTFNWNRKFFTTASFYLTAHGMHHGIYACSIGHHVCVCVCAWKRHRICELWHEKLNVIPFNGMLFFIYMYVVSFSVIVWRVLAQFTICWSNPFLLFAQT